MALENIQRDRQTEFVASMIGLDRAGRAALRKNAGSPLAEARGDGMAVFYSLLPRGIPQYQEEVYFLVATLMAAARTERDVKWMDENREQCDFGWSLWKVFRENDQREGRDAKVRAILDSRIETWDGSFHHRLQQLTRLMDSRSIPVNWASLLTDLLQWNRTDKSVQKSWARKYFARNKEVAE